MSCPYYYYYYYPTSANPLRVPRVYNAANVISIIITPYDVGHGKTAAVSTF